MKPKAPTKAALLAARREELGRCVALTQKATECTNWAVDRVGDAAYCGQHLAGIATREDEARRSAIKRTATITSIDAYLASRGQVAHDCGEVCWFSETRQGPRVSELVSPG